MKISKDVNGNKTLVITKSDLAHWRGVVKSGFSIQTVGNLPLTHKEGITFTTKNEVFDYINQFGTKRQKASIGCDSDLNLRNFIEQKTFSSVLFKELTEDDLDQIVNIIGGHSATKSRIRSILDYHLSGADFWGVSDRFMYDVSLGRWSYCAGQDYIYEMKMVRKHLLR